MLTLSRQLHARQQATLSPRLQQAVQLLHLSTTEFLQAMESALQRNPFLEGEPAGCSPLGEPTSHEAAPPEASSKEDHRVAVEASWEASPASWATSRNQRSGNSDLTALDYAVSSTTLYEHLHSQLRLMRLSDRQLLLASVIVESLEEDGYLRTPLQEIADIAELVPAPCHDELLQALALVQTLDPLGIGARDLCECLRLQLSLVPEGEDRCLAMELLTHHAKRLANMDLRVIARELGCATERVVRAVQALRRLDPHPGWHIGGPPAHYVLPDVIVRKTLAGWSVALNADAVPRIRMNRMYVDLAERQARGSNAALAHQLSEARWTVRQAQQRVSTILSVAQAILRRQQRFLDYGAIALQPLTLREIAEEVGTHESTVSRVTHGKYMSTPCGTYELKYFFSRALPTTVARSQAPKAVQSLVQDLIAAEPRENPLSDVAIAQILARQGVPIARRTVTKYRQLLGIPSLERRHTLPPR